MTTAGDILAAVSAAQALGVFATPMSGIQAPTPISGINALFPPHWGYADGGDVSTMVVTATRLYYVPYFFPAIIQYAGLKLRNTSAADTGLTMRLGVYQADKSTGKPSALIVDGGLITLGAAAADQTLATPWTPPYIGWGFLCFHSGGTPTVRRFSNVNPSSPTFGAATPNMTMFGHTATATAGKAASNFSCYYVDTAFGALASTGVAPTAVLESCPAIYPYRA